MATTSELKSRAFDSDIDSSDPLMELSRIIGLSPANAKAPDPQLSIEDSFALDLERELNDPKDAVEFDFGDEFQDAVDNELSAAIDLGSEAPSLEPSLEDELAALLDGNQPVASAVVAPVPYENALPEFPEVEQFEELVADEISDTGVLVEAESPADDELAFDSEDWLDVPLEASEGAVSADSEPDYSVQTHDDPVFSEMTRPILAREDVSLVNPEPISATDDYSVHDGAAELPELEAEFELASGFNQPEIALESEMFAADPEFDAELLELETDTAEPEDYQPNTDMEVTHASVFKPELDFEQMLARTAPQPVVDSVAALPDAIEAIEEFDIPDFEFEPEPVAEANPAFGLEDDFAEVAAPATGWRTELPAASAPATASVDEDFDFDSMLDEELEVAAGNSGETVGYAGTLAAAGAGYVAGRTFAQNANPTANDPDLDIFREDVAPNAYQDEAPRKRNWMAAAAVVGAIVVAGAGALWAFSGSPTSTTDGNVALVKADADPVKIAPENPGGKVVANQDKAVYDSVSGQQATLPNGGQLVSESEEPLDIAAATPAEAEAGKSEARIEPNTAIEAASGQAVDTLAIAPKKVKTFIVKQDGTLVERPAEVVPVVEQASAPVETPAAPVEQMAAAPVATETPAPESVAPEPAVEAPQPVETAAVPAEPIVAPAEPAVPAAAQPVEPAIKVVKTKKIKAPVEEAPVEQVAAAPAASDAPVPERPAEQPVDIVGQTGGQQAPAQEQQVASLDPAAAAPVAVPGGYTIQIASTPSPEAAKATYAALTRKFGNVISGRGVSIQKADVAGKGTVYRVRIPAGSKSEANSLCAKYKSAGGSCFVSK